MWHKVQVSRNSTLEFIKKKLQIFEIFLILQFFFSYFSIVFLIRLIKVLRRTEKSGVSYQCSIYDGKVG